jgi:RHS repeat-associated protein
VDIGSGNLILDVPIISLPGRHMPFNYGLRYNALFWTVATRTQTNGSPRYYWSVERRPYIGGLNNGLGFTPTQPQLSWGTSTETCTNTTHTDEDTKTTASGYIYTDAGGGKHQLPIVQISATSPDGGCFAGQNGTGVFQGFVAGEGIFARVSDIYSTPAVYLPDGTQVAWPTDNSILNPPATPDGWVPNDLGHYQDANGNSKCEPGGCATIVDTLGRNPLTIVNGANQILYKVYDSSGTQQTYTVNLGTISVNTNFGIAGVTESSQTRTVVTSIGLPNGTSYSFQYEPNSYGGLSSVTLPTGATISYTWATLSPSGNTFLTHRYISARTVTVGSKVFNWSFNKSCVDPGCFTVNTDVVDPQGNHTLYQHTDGKVVSAKIYSGAVGSTLLRQYDILYNPALPDPNALPIRITTTLKNGLQSKVEYDYDTTGNVPGNVSEIREYGYDGTLIRRTHNVYGLNTNSAYLALNIVDKVTQQSIYDSTSDTCKGQAGACAQTQYEYDSYLTNENPLQSTSSTSAPQHDYTGYGSSFTLRGNATRVKHWSSADSAWLTSTYTYDDLGNIRAIKDPLGHVTSYDYGDSFYGSYCLPPSGTNAQAYVTQVANAKSQQIQLTRYPCTGLVQAHKNQNDLDAHLAGTTQTFDLMNRPLITDFVDGGRVTMDYHGDALPLKSTKTTKITSALNLIASSTTDGLGRTVTTSLDSDPEGADYTDTNYDVFGQVSVSNPHRSAASSTDGTTQTLYDPLGRAYQTTKQDGSISSVDYDVPMTVAVNADCTQTTDEAGNQRAACADALGRLVEVVEPNPGSVATSATGSVTISGGEQTNNVGVSITVANSGFETPSLGSGANAYQYHPTGSSWTFGANSGVDSNNNIVGGSGITGNNSGFTSSNPAAPEGTQVAFLQGGSANFISQSLSGFQAGVNYTVYFQAAQRGNFNAGGEDFDVYLDSTFLATFNPASTSYALLSTPAFTTPAGVHTIKFVGRDSAGGNGNAAFIDAVQVTGSVVIPNSSFETPALGTGNFQYSPTGGSWTFGGGTGISANGSGFTSGNPGAPQGGQVAFIQFGSDDVFSQSLSGFQAGVSYTVSFSAAQRGNSSNGGQDFDVYLDSTLLGTFRPASTSYSTLSTNPFTTTAGTHTLKFVGRDSAGGNNTAFIDAVQITGTVALADVGTVTISVNGMPYSTSFGSGDTPATIASRLATAISAGSYASATASGGTVNLTSKTGGTIGDYSVTASSTWNSAQFTNPSFTTSTSGAGLSGAYNAGDIRNNPFVTLYGYDALGNLLRVDQKGTAPNDSSQWRTRTFTYDSLSRLLTANNPESGTITYSYDADGELLQKTSPAPNQTGTATQTVSYCYDALHRVTGKGYGTQTCPLATPVVTYTYDLGTNAKGHLTSLIDQAGTASYAYDSMGRLNTETRVLTGANNLAFSKNLIYEYNLDGSLYKLHYPSGNVVTYTMAANGSNSAGRVGLVKDQGNNINYVTGAGTSSYATYSPDGAPTGFLSGYSTSFAGITNAFTYNQRLQPVNMSANAPGQTVFSIGYDFHVGNGTSGADNGNVFGITNYKDQTRNQTFTYDILNRLVSARNAGTDCTVTILGGLKKFWGNTYTYDAWGNLTTKALLQTPPPPACSGESLSVTVGSDNRLGSGYLYDAAGNMTFNATPPTQNYTYDQENRLTGAAGYTYTYDSDGNRVRKSSGSTGTLYWYMTPGIVGESDLSGNLTDEYVFFAGERVARKSTNGVFYYFSDHLKTASVITDSAGTIKAESDYYPWGGELQFVANDSNHYKFTGKERDSETQLDYFGARSYSGALGRFITPDWSAKVEPVPYSKSDNPQTLNLYSYVLNNPLGNIDTDGHACVTLYGNNSSGFCQRATEYGKIDAISGVQSKTRFFAAANAVSQALADVATPISSLLVSKQTANFLEGVGQKLEKLNQAEASAIQNGSLKGSNLDQQLVHTEQSAVQGQLDSLKQSDSAAYSKTITEINGSLNGLVTKGLEQLTGTDRAYAGVLAGVRKDLGRDIDFSKQSDREAIGNALIKHVRQTGGCDINGKKQPGC